MFILKGDKLISKFNHFLMVYFKFEVKLLKLTHFLFQTKPVVPPNRILFSALVFVFPPFSFDSQPTLYLNLHITKFTSQNQIKIRTISRGSCYHSFQNFL